MPRPPGVGGASGVVTASCRSDGPPLEMIKTEDVRKVGNPRRVPTSACSHHPTGLYGAPTRSVCGPARQLTEGPRLRGGVRSGSLSRRSRSRQSEVNGEANAMLRAPGDCRRCGSSGGPARALRVGSGRPQDQVGDLARLFVDRQVAGAGDRGQGDAGRRFKAASLLVAELYVVALAESDPGPAHPSRGSGWRRRRSRLLQPSGLGAVGASDPAAFEPTCSSAWRQSGPSGVIFSEGIDSIFSQQRKSVAGHDHSVARGQHHLAAPFDRSHYDPLWQARRAQLLACRRRVGRDLSSKLALFELRSVTRATLASSSAR